MEAAGCAAAGAWVGFCGAWGATVGTTELIADTLRVVSSACLIGWKLPNIQHSEDEVIVMLQTLTAWLKTLHFTHAARCSPVGLVHEDAQH